LDFTGVANGTDCGAINVFTATGTKFTIVCRVVFCNFGCLVEKELARGASCAGGGRGVTAVLDFTGVANGTECGAINVFTATGTKFTIVWRVVFGQDNNRPVVVK